MLKTPYGALLSKKYRIKVVYSQWSFCREITPREDSFLSIGSVSVTPRNQPRRLECRQRPYHAVKAVLIAMALIGSAVSQAQATKTYPFHQTDCPGDRTAARGDHAALQRGEQRGFLLTAGINRAYGRPRLPGKAENL